MEKENALYKKVISAIGDLCKPDFSYRELLSKSNEELIEIWYGAEKRVSDKLPLGFLRYLSPVKSIGITNYEMTSNVLKRKLETEILDSENEAGEPLELKDREYL